MNALPDGNCPPATMSPFGSAATVCTVPASAPTLVHCAPSQRATPQPGALNVPPATRSPFGITTSDRTVAPFVPLPNPVPTADHAVPFQRATLSTTTPPADWKR